jgi:hypothetical protein
MRLSEKKDELTKDLNFVFSLMEVY